MNELNMEQVSKFYGKTHALDQFSHTLTDGIYGLLGPNGAGKTTLIHIIVRLISSSAGRVVFNGKDIVKAGNAYFDHIGYMPQYPKFYPDYSAYELLDYLCAIKGIGRKDARERILQMLEFVNLSDAAKKKVGAFSGGMRQRLGIAAVMLNNPSVLILDEPTAGLDPKERIRFRNLISKLGENRIVLLATHIVSDIEYIAKEVLMLGEGKLLAVQTPEQLIAGMTGKVWNAPVAEKEEMERLMAAYITVNVQNAPQGYVLRLVSAEQPHENATPAIPNLEDVYLSFFGEAAV
ncbi:MAG: ABC transporter ATP-binding protein [Oscillospiraceae bacterium]